MRAKYPEQLKDISMKIKRSAAINVSGESGGVLDVFLVLIC